MEVTLAQINPTRQFVVLRPKGAVYREPLVA